MSFISLNYKLLPVIVSARVKTTTESLVLMKNGDKYLLSMYAQNSGILTQQKFGNRKILKILNVF